MRSDLLALSEDDLAALSNRGTLKRAVRELDEAALTAEIEENEAGDVTVRWSDDATCTFPAGKVLADAQCTCPALGTCRHLVRSVLAYQRNSAADGPAADEETSTEPWDPGRLDNAAVSAALSTTALRRAKATRDAGQVVELVRSHKPWAHFMNASCTIRFLVPGDARYVHCDCAEQAPCQHAALAIWAFRELPPEQSAGLVTLGDLDDAAPENLIAEIERNLGELVANGCGNLPTLWRDRLARLQQECLTQTLVWPADLLAEMISEYDRYQTHDARFDSQHLVELVGEMLTRCDALGSNQQEVPRVLIRGMRGDRETPVGSARLSGLGCGVTVTRHSTRISAFLQDATSGATVTVSRWFDQSGVDEDAELAPFWRMAGRTVVKDISLAQVGSGQLIAAGGKRSAGHELNLGRQRVGVNPQSFQWEQLRAPLLVESLSELAAQLRSRPPAGLRPRRLTNDLRVCQVAELRQARFDPAAHELVLDAVDAEGTSLEIRHPYTSQGHEGFEALQLYCNQPALQLRFVAGQVRLRSGCLVASPTCLVWEQGRERICLQPWVDRYSVAARAITGETPSEPETETEPAEMQAGVLSDPLKSWTAELADELGALAVRGLSRADHLMVNRWQQLADQAQSVGLVQIGQRVANLASALAQKSHTPNWDKAPAVEAGLTLCVLLTLMLDR